VLRCRGDEDVTTQGRRRRALAQAQAIATDVIVDLRELTFADASLMVDFANLARRLRLGGRNLVLSGAQPQIVRLIEMVGLHRQPGVQVAPAGSPALA
jgi:anti-anti-sigma factor